MKKIALSVVLLVVFASFTGCGSKPAGEQTENKPSSQKASENLGTGETSVSSQSNKNEPDDKELNEVVKRFLAKGPLAELPLEITDIAVNWEYKSIGSASGKFSAKTKTTEKLYKSVDNKDGLKKLDVTELFEGEVNAARDKTGNLPEPHKTNLRNDVPKDNLNWFRFYEVHVPLGGEVTVTGSVELAKYGNDWQSDRLQVRDFSCGNNYTPESKLDEGYWKLDDPKAKEAVEAVIQARKDFAAKVDETIAELEKQRLAALKQQKDDFDTFCAPGKKYEGSFRLGSTSGAVRITFDESATADKNSVKGTVSYLGYTQIKFGFTVAVNTQEVTNYPVIGQVVKPRNTSIHYILRGDEPGDFGLTGREPDYETLATMLHNKDKIAIKFVDVPASSESSETRRKMIFTVSGYDVGYYENERITLSLAEAE